MQKHSDILHPFSHHSHSVGRQQLLGAHGCDVGDVGKNINKSDQWDGDVDGTRQIPERRKSENTHTHILIFQRGAGNL